MKDKNIFLQSHIEGLEINGFWNEIHKSSLIFYTECLYKKEIISQYGISDIVINGDKVLLKWFKRITPHGNGYMKEKYGM